MVLTFHVASFSVFSFLRFFAYFLEDFRRCCFKRVSATLLPGGFGIAASFFSIFGSTLAVSSPVAAGLPRSPGGSDVGSMFGFVRLCFILCSSASPKL